MISGPSDSVEVGAVSTVLAIRAIRAVPAVRTSCTVDTISAIEAIMTTSTVSVVPPRAVRVFPVAVSARSVVGNTVILVRWPNAISSTDGDGKGAIDADQDLYND